MFTGSISRLAISLALLFIASYADAQLLLSWQTWQDTQFAHAGLGREAIKRDQYLVNYRWQGKDQDRQIAYAHQPLLIRTGDPAHNGYFHRLDYGVYNQNGNLSIKLTTGLHGSSNMFNHFKFHDDGFVASGQILYELEGCQCEFGFNGDYRFGPFHYYLVLQKQWLFNNGAQLALSAPYALAYLSKDEQWQIGIERYGEKWGALDKSREVESSYFLEEWQVTARYRIVENLYGNELFLRVGLSFDTALRYQDLVAGDREEDIDRAVFVGLEFKQRGFAK
jgi:hypothetical protein